MAETVHADRYTCKHCVNRDIIDTYYIGVHDFDTTSALGPIKLTVIRSMITTHKVPKYCRNDAWKYYKIAKMV